MPRAVLWQRLDIATRNPLTLLVAPVGAGKTLGVSGWLQRTEESTEAAWVHADPSWTPDRLDAVLDWAAGDTDAEALPPRLVVVDDAQALPRATLQMIDSRLNDRPLEMRLLLLSRWDLPLARLVPELLGHSTTLRGELLRMDPAESATLVVEHARTEDPTILRAVFERTQGWCALVVLTARAIATAPDPVAAAERYAAAGASVADQVASEVFAALHPRERHLLLCLAGDEVVSTGTARHLTHDPRADEILSDLETTGLLVSRLPYNRPQSPDLLDVDDDSLRYRIHPLLAEVTRRRLVAGGVDVARARSTVVRAVRLDRARGDASQAIARLVAVNALEEAANILAEDGLVMVTQGRGATISDFVSRHPEAVEASPRCWFPIALGHWFVDDIPAATHWLDRALATEESSDARSARTACIRLMRSRLGLEPIGAAVGQARQVVLLSHSDPHPPPELPLLLSELGITQNWLGDLADAEVNLSTAIALSKARNLTGLATSALTHLAFTEYMQGHERGCAELAREALDALDGDPVGRSNHTATRASLALVLGTLSDLPWQTAESVAADEHEAVHSADLTTRFWRRLRDARLALMSGSVASSERTLELLRELPSLPEHLRVAVLLERAFLAGLSGDQDLLKEVVGQLAEVGSLGEVALAQGLRDDLLGDRRGAADNFAAAALDVTFSQPATRALALACEAQLRDALGDHEQAHQLVREAVTATEVRRNAVPFLGWTHQGTPMSTLLAQLDDETSPSWLHELAESAAGRPDVTSLYAPTTATPRERESTPEPLVRPTLSPREREVLNELARGSTYADIAANLFVSENTIKTHVSSLYGKLSVGRRSEALAVARKLHLL
ncbi:MAG TPA: LuxR C-terminal-related transcriptional regulator [Nocardioides sp.]|nr:LuxR C-terminal-related transcriptional regulator [Nocardioides sp.]